MSSDARDRTTSFAKTVEGLAQEESSLDKVDHVRNEFNRTADETRQPLPGERISDQDKARQGDDRIVTHAPAPGMSLKPRGRVRASMDRTIDYEKLRAINRAAQTRSKAAERSRDLSRDFGRER